MVEYWNDILTIAAIEAIVSLGLYVILSTGQLSVGHAAFMGIGAYFAGMATAIWGMPFPAGLVLSIIVPALGAVIVAILILRLKHMFLAVATFGFGEALVVVLINTEYVGGPFGLSKVPLVTTTPLVAIMLVAAIFFVARLENSRTGQAFRVINDDDVAAGAIGIDPRAMRVLAFAVGSGIAGLGGGLYVHYLGYIEPTGLGFAHSMIYLVYVAIGGVTTLWGAVFGTFALRVVPELLGFSMYDRYVLYGLVLVAIVLFRPKGILSRRPIGAPPSFFERWLAGAWGVRRPPRAQWDNDQGKPSADLKQGDIG